MSRAHFEDECPGCRPVILNPKTGKVYPPDSPEMVVLDEVWAGTTYGERQAFHEVTCRNSREPKTLMLAQAIMARYETILKKMEPILRRPDATA